MSRAVVASPATKAAVKAATGGVDRPKRSRDPGVRATTFRILSNSVGVPPDHRHCGLVRLTTMAKRTPAAPVLVLCSDDALRDSLMDLSVTDGDVCRGALRRLGVRCRGHRRLRCVAARLALRQVAFDLPAGGVHGSLPESSSPPESG